MSGELENSRRFRAKYFSQVISAYASCREYPPVVAIRYDDGERPNARLTPTVIEYLVDCDNATHQALDRFGLFPEWLTMVTGEPVPADKKARISDLCGRIYVARRLHPYDYFKSVRGWKATA